MCFLLGQGLAGVVRLGRVRSERRAGCLRPAGRAWMSLAICRCAGAIGIIATDCPRKTGVIGRDHGRRLCGAAAKRYPDD
jgi:hypothetical protein